MAVAEGEHAAAIFISGPIAKPEPANHCRAVDMKEFIGSDLANRQHCDARTNNKISGHWVERMTASLRAPVAVLLSWSLISAVPAAAQDVAYGEYLSSQCTTCHQLSGKDKGIPSIIGWDTESFVAVMGSYKRKERENQAMQTIAASMGDEEIAALAAYFATLKPKE
jgi:cytochrome c553